MTVNELFAGNPVAGSLFHAVCGVVDSLGGDELRVMKSQISFRRTAGAGRR